MNFTVKTHRPMKQTFTRGAERVCAVFAAAALLMASCAKESLPQPSEGNDPTVPPTPAGQYIRFVAGAPAAEDGAAQSPVSRAGYDSATGHAVWEAGDRIGVFVSGVSANDNTLFTQKAGTLSADRRKAEYEGTFGTEVAGTQTLYAVYPYDSGATISGTTLTTTFPGHQVYSPDGYTGIPLLGKYEGDISGLAFERFLNPFAVIELRLASESPVNVTRIVFQGNNDETVAGTIEVEMSGDRPAVSFAASRTSNSITLDCGDGVALTAEPTSFYIAIPVQEYAKGYRFDIRTDREGANAVVLKAKSGGVTPVANTIYGTPAKTLATADFKYIIPDANFRNYLATDGWVTVDDETTGAVTIDNKTGRMYCDSKKISSLEGIEYFPQLTYLSCAYNQLTSLDVTKNTDLGTLQCTSNRLLTELDLTKNTRLTGLSCNYNRLTELDVTQNTSLTSIYCSYNQLTELDVTKNTSLTYLQCSYNRLTSLDVTLLTSLNYLFCESNRLTELDVTKNTKLISMYCFSNQLTALDVTKNTDLAWLECFSNQLTELDASQMAEPTGYWLYCGKQADADGNAITLQLTLREELRRRWDQTLKSNGNNASVAVPTYVPNP